MKTKILLFDAQGYWLKREKEEPDQVVLPLGLMYLASYSREKFGDNVEFKIYNSMVDFDNDPQEIAKCFSNEKPNIIGIRGMTRYRQEFAQIARLAKENTDALVIGGGPFVSSDDHAGLKDGIDIAVIDEGEVTFAELIGKYLKQESMRDVHGIAFFEEGIIRRTTKRPFMTSEELEAQPFPSYDLIDMEKYASQVSYGYNKRRQGVIYTSRGCPYRCDFCHVLFGKKFRQRGPESLFREFQWLFEQHDVRDFYIVDDIFNLQKERAIDFFKKISTSAMAGKIRIYFVNGLRGDRVDEEFIDAAVDAGTVWLAYAVETSSLRLQKQIQKNLDVEKVRKAIEYSYKKNVAVIYWGMLGIDSETLDEAKGTVDFLNSLPPSTIPMLFSLKPYPGTGAYNKLVASGKNLDEIAKFQFLDTGSSYHSFAGLVSRDANYYDVIKKWMEKVQSPERMQLSTKSLVNIGHTNEEIEVAYRLLYRKLPQSSVRELIERCR